MARKPPRSTRRGFGRLRQFRSGRWKASYTGPDHKLYEAEHTFAARIDAEAWLTDRRREIDNGLWNPGATAEQKQAARRNTPAAVKFADYAARWVATRTVKGRPLRLRTVDHYEQILASHLLPTFGNKPITAITMDSVDRWYADTLTEYPAMRVHAYSLLHAILETAHTRDRIIDTNPCVIRGAGTPAARKIKPRPASVEQITAITNAMPTEYQVMVLLAAWCAMRFGELVELRRGDIDLTEGVVHVRRAAVRARGEWKVGDPKSDAGIRDVAIPPHLLPTIKRHLALHVGRGKGALLFPAKSGADKHLQPSALTRHWYKARAAAGRDDLRFHDLRHSGAVLAALTGATLAELMQRLGHSTPQAAMRYQHAAQGRDKQIAALLSKLAQP